MKRVVYSREAELTVDNYFESYIGSASHNDLTERAYRLSRIRVCLTYIEVFTDNTFTIDGRNYIAVEDFAKVEYLEYENEILILNIFFKNKC